MKSATIVNCWNKFLKIRNQEMDNQNKYVKYTYVEY